MLANTEYLGVLSQIVKCIRSAMHDDRLPDLTAEEVTNWLHSMTVDDVRSVWGQPERK